jgi:hypothetical protein
MPLLIDSRSPNLIAEISLLAPCPESKLFGSGEFRIFKITAQLQISPLDTASPETRHSPTVPFPVLTTSNG